jgi:anti-anti-sigma factor
MDRAARGRFSCVAREVDSVLRVAFTGELDLEMAIDAGEALREPLSASALTVVLNLREVSYIDSAGLKLIVDTKRAIESRGGRFYLSDPSLTVKRLLELAHLTSWFDWVDGAESSSRPCPACGSTVSALARRCTACDASRPGR